MASGRGTRVPEAELCSGLARVYRYGYLSVLALMLVGLIHPLTGWKPAEVIYTTGIILLLCIPLITTLWVGLKAIMNRDRGLMAISLGILVLVIIARLISSLL